MTPFQSSELTELPVVENSQLFAQCAQRVHSARYAPQHKNHTALIPSAYSRRDSFEGLSAGTVGGDPGTFAEV